MSSFDYNEKYINKLYKQDIGIQSRYLNFAFK